MTGLWRLWQRARELWTRVVLAVLWGLVVTPMAVVLRVVREDPLQRRFEPARETYWETRHETPTSGLVGFLVARGKVWLVPLVLVLLAVGVLVVLSEGSAALLFLYPLF